MYNFPNLPPSGHPLASSNVMGATFGQSASSYAIGRKGYPDGVFDLLSSQISKDMDILELGCGTGLATKQLCDRGFKSIAATDVDPLMLNEARGYCPEVSFQQADANAMPFSDNAFDSVIAFGCFHWFCNPQAINEIKRVLKPQGVLFIVNKYDSGSFRKDFVKFLQDADSKMRVETKTHYHPEESLANQGFSVAQHVLQTEEIFTGEEFLAYCQSISLWTSMAVEKQNFYFPLLEQFISRMMKEKHYERPIEVQCLVALKNLA